MDYTQHPHLNFERKFFKFFGAEISVIDPNSSQLVGFIHMKAFKLREDIRLFSDKSMQQEIMRIQARQIIDFGATYDVFDSTSNELLFSMRRKGFKSTFVRDHWDLIDAQGNIFASLQETSGGLALARRWLSMISDLAGLIFAFVKETYVVQVPGPAGQQQIAANIVHSKNPILVRMSLDTANTEVKLDPRIPVASTALLAIVDASKNG